MAGAKKGSQLTIGQKWARDGYPTVIPPKKGKGPKARKPKRSK